MTSTTTTYLARRARIETYFDRTAFEAWAKLTSTSPVGRIRATVRAGRDRMRATLLDCLPADLTGRRILDAGCGTGAFALEAARRGADVVAVDLSPTLVSLARERIASIAAPVEAARIAFVAGDMLDAAHGRFDHAVCMDSLIHYRSEDIVAALSRLAERTERSIAFTFAPSNPLLASMITVGRLFPRRDRAPFIEPVAEAKLRGRIVEDAGLAQWNIGRSERIASGFYTSHAMELRRA